MSVCLLDKKQRKYFSLIFNSLSHNLTQNLTSSLIKPLTIPAVWFCLSGLSHNLNFSLHLECIQSLNLSLSLIKGLWCWVPSQWPLGHSIPLIRSIFSNFQNKKEIPLKASENRHFFKPKGRAKKARRVLICEYPKNTLFSYLLTLQSLLGGPEISICKVIPCF